MSRPTPDDVLAALDPEQREVATALTGPVCVLAGAGTGKTRAITSRIAYGVLAGVLTPQRVLAVTFTTRAAAEMRARLRSLRVEGVQARTFHSAALRQLQYFWPRVVGGPLPRLVEQKAPLVAEAAARQRIGVDRVAVRDLAAEIEWTKVTLTHREDYATTAACAGRLPPAGLDGATTARILSAYEDIKRERAALDFEDVLLYAVGLLADHPDVAGQVRAQYTSFVVDEFQDVSPLQQQLLDLWLGGRHDVCVVGDASQTIYSFAGATPDYLLGFRQRHPEAKVVRLQRNYRSSRSVLVLANGLLRQARGPAAAARVELVAQRPDGPQPVFTEYADEDAEAASVADRIRRLLEGGTRASEIAVLFRTNGQSATLEAALTDAGIPYLLRGGERFFARREIREAHLLLRGAARASANADHTADRAPPGEAGDERPASPGDLAAEVGSVLASLGWIPQPPTGAGGGAVRARWESLNALVALAEDLGATRAGATLADLVAELDERAAAQHAPTVQGVTLASLHAAKGLEWDAVFLVGLSEGLLPIGHAETPEAIEEERRLLYVGVTRARRHLALSWAMARTPGGRASRVPSRFLDGIRPASGSPRGKGAGGAGSRRRRTPARGPAMCRVCGRPLADAVARKLGRCASCPAALDEKLFERLRTWRLDRAREQSVPAYVVFTDATLTAIAEATPTSPADLARIPGVGATKLDRYGADVLRICSER